MHSHKKFKKWVFSSMWKIKFHDVAEVGLGKNAILLQPFLIRARQTKKKEGETFAFVFFHA